MTRQCGLPALPRLPAEVRTRPRGPGSPSGVGLRPGLLPGPGGRAAWVRIVFGQVRIGAGPSTSRGNRSGVASAFRRPGGLRWKRRAGRPAPTWAGGEFLLRELVSSAPLSGLLDTSLPLLWLRDGPAQSLGESSSQTPSSPLLRGHPSWGPWSTRRRHPVALRLPPYPC